MATVAACHREARASASYSGNALLPVSALTLTLDANGIGWIFHGADSAIAGTFWRSPELNTPTSGTLTVAYELRTAGGLASAGGVSLQMRRDWTWGVDVRVDSANPIRTCFGCAGSKGFMLAPFAQRTPKDSVWVVWGGNSISRPVVY
jgi:hypothetical protein